MVVFKWPQITTLGVITAFSLPNVIDAIRSGLEDTSILPGAYIVEFEENPSAAPTRPDNFYSYLETYHVNTNPRLGLSHTLFNGASFDLLGSHDNESTLAMIKSMTMIKQMWPVYLRDPQASAISTRKFMAAKSPSFKKRANSSIDSYIPHVMGGVNKLRNEGYSGEGLYVAVIDTGVDYRHPALGGGFGPGYKIAHGYDLVGDAYTGSNRPVPDDDPMDCEGHGTHVSGIVGADANNPYSFTGVVPNATLGMYKVFGCTGSVSDDVVIAAFNMAFESGADVITASLGGNLGWVEGAPDVVVSRIVAAGTPCSISLGNSGANGAFYAGSPAEAIGITAVGSIDSLSQPALLFQAFYKKSNNTKTLGFGFAGGDYADFGTGSFPLYAITLNSTVTDDACTPLPASTPDLSKYVVLIRRGVCNFDQKIAAATAFGAKRIMFYNNIPGEPLSPADTGTTIPVGMVSSSLGANWISSLAAALTITVDLTAQADTGFIYQDPMNNLTGGYMSTFSSWGPTYELFVKPEISAPGGFIISTYPRALGSYAVASGTSMATPFIAGCIALIKQVRGKETSPLEIQTLLASTAKPVDFNDGTAKSYAGTLAPVIQQGGGLVDVFAAAKAKTILSVSKLAFNDTAHFVSKNPFTIKNDGPRTVTYSLGNIGAATVLTLDANSIFPSAFPPELLQNPATIKFTPETVTIKPGSEVEIIVELTPPSGLEVTRIPIYSGYVTINGTTINGTTINGTTTNGTTVSGTSDFLTLPYAGVAASMYDTKLTDTTDGYPILSNSSDASHTAISTSTNASMPYFTLPHRNSSTTSNTAISYPSISWKLAMGSRIVRIDVIPANNRSKTQETLGVKSLGSILNYPMFENTRGNIVQTSWTGQLANASFVPAGKYRLLFRALKIFGDAENGDDYEAFETGMFGIKYLR